MKHQHKYDVNGKQICCILEEKIHYKTDKKTGCCTTDNEPENHSDDDGHNHGNEDKHQSTFKKYLPATISFLLLVSGIVFEQTKASFFYYPVNLI